MTSSSLAPKDQRTDLNCAADNASALQDRLARRALATHILEIQVAQLVDDIGKSAADILTALIEAQTAIGQINADDEAGKQAASAHLMTAMAGIQFEDRVRQKLNGVCKSLLLSVRDENTVAQMIADPQFVSDEPHLDRAIFDTYISECQRRIHRGEGGECAENDAAGKTELLLF